MLSPSLLSNDYQKKLFIYCPFGQFTYFLVLYSALVKCKRCVDIFSKVRVPNLLTLTKQKLNVRLVPLKVICLVLQSQWATTATVSWCIKVIKAMKTVAESVISCQPAQESRNKITINSRYRQIRGDCIQCRTLSITVMNFCMTYNGSGTDFDYLYAI